MDIFSSDKAPYAFVLMISVLGWFLTNTVSEGRKHLLLTYSSEIVSDADEPYLRLVLKNESVELPFTGIAVELTCQDDTPCLSSTRTATGTAIAVAQMLPPWSIELNPAVSDSKSSQLFYSFSPTIPAGASLTIVAGLVDAKMKPDVLLSVPNTTTLAPDLAEGFSIYGYLFRNYFSILLIGGALSILIFAVWIALVGYRSTRPVAQSRGGQHDEAMG